MLAEASSGEFLLQSLPDVEGQVRAVVRRVEAKFRSPLQGGVFSRAVTTRSEVRRSAELLTTRGRAIIPVVIEIVNRAGTVGAIATFEWFVSR